MGANYPTDVTNIQFKHFKAIFAHPTVSTEGVKENIRECKTFSTMTAQLIKPLTFILHIPSVF